jgi:hypothetical protein
MDLRILPTLIMNFVFISALLTAPMCPYVQDLGFIEKFMVEAQRFLVLGEGRHHGGRHDDGGNVIWMLKRFQMTRGDQG